MSKSNEQKILEKKEKIDKLKNKVRECQQEINTLEKQIIELQNLDIQGLIKELNIPFNDVKKALMEYTRKTTEETNKKVHKNE